jgi:malate dehydrogenase
MRPKVTVVGSGNVGASCALRLADRGLADVVVDIRMVSQGKALDMPGRPVAEDVKVAGANECAATLPISQFTWLSRKPGMSRDDLCGPTTTLSKPRWSR